MFLELVNPIANVISKILDKIPDGDEKIKLQAQMQEELIQVLSDADKAQDDVNKQEAANPNLFVSGWRPAAGWVCVFALGLQYIIQPFFCWILTLLQVSFIAPKLELGELITLLLGMLGMSGLRSLDKYTGTK